MLQRGQRERVSHGLWEEWMKKKAREGIGTRAHIVCIPRNQEWDQERHCGWLCFWSHCDVASHSHCCFHSVRLYHKLLNSNSQGCECKAAKDRSAQVWMSLVKANVLKWISSQDGVSLLVCSYTSHVCPVKSVYKSCFLSVFKTRSHPTFDFLKCIIK